MKARILLVLSAAVLLTSCSHGTHSSSVLDTVKAAAPAPANVGVTLDAHFDPQRLVPVESNGQRFSISNRETKLEKFPCAQCHKVPLAQIKHDGKDGKTRAHWSVRLQHAPESVMNCKTCHEAEDMSKLRTLNGKQLSMNDSWQVCGQCHFKQAKDWSAGAHGKRLAGWAPPRVVQTCAECHDPHKPAWNFRQPVHTALTGVAQRKERD